MDLSDLFALRPGSLTDDVEQFVAGCLADGGVWETPRTSDGITELRVLKREPEVLQVCGKIISIQQEERGFWLEFERNQAGLLCWTLSFGIVAGSARKRRHALLLAESADDIEWDISMTGTAVVRDGVPRVL